MGPRQKKDIHGTVPATPSTGEAPAVARPGKRGKRR
jgi:hypothetical protein